MALLGFPGFGCPEPFLFPVSAVYGYTPAELSLVSEGAHWSWAPKGTGLCRGWMLGVSRWLGSAGVATLPVRVLVLGALPEHRCQGGLMGGAVEFGMWGRDGPVEVKAKCRGSC
jgi:hypothetical protein